MRLEFWTSFLSFFPNLSFSYLDDFVADEGKQARNYVGKSAKNLVDFVENGVNEIEQHIDVKTVVLAAQDQTDSKKNLDNSSIPGCTSWSKDCNWVWCRLHSYCQGTSIEPDILDIPRIGGSRHSNRCNPDLAFELG